MPKPEASPLPPERQPRLLRMAMPPAVITRVRPAEEELRVQAAATDHGTYGYFVDRPSEKPQPASRALAKAWPSVYTAGEQFDFSWARLSLGRQPSPPSYHLDADVGTGLAGEDVDEFGVPTSAAWRLLVNLHRFSDRTFGYLNVDPRALEWEQEEGYIKLADGQDVRDFEKPITIRHRVGRELTGLLVCVSQVAHAGVETRSGHFLGSWSMEEAA